MFSQPEWERRGRYVHRQRATPSGRNSNQGPRQRKILNFIALQACAGQHAGSLSWAQAQIGGKIAQLGERLVAGAAKKIADLFLANFATALTQKQG